MAAGLWTEGCGELDWWFGEHVIGAFRCHVEEFGFDPGVCAGLPGKGKEALLRRLPSNEDTVISCKGLRSHHNQKSCQ